MISPVTLTFVGEGAPIPVRKFNLVATHLEPFKLAGISRLTAEMIHASTAEDVVRQALLDATGPSLDAALFSTTAGSSLRPPGLLNGVTPLTAFTATNKTDAMIDDVAAIAAALAQYSGNGQVGLIASPKRYVALQMRSPQKITFPVWESAIAAGTVIGVALPALA